MNELDVEKVDPKGGANPSPTTTDIGPNPAKVFLEPKSPIVTQADRYQKQFRDNYYGRSDCAKELSEYLRKRDTGRVKVDYIPWAVLHRMALMQDPNFKREKMRATTGPYAGTFLFYNGRPANVGPTITPDDACYFVQVRVVYMGVELIEEYPVQDFNFEPVNFDGKSFTMASGKTKTISMDSNIINKALQRAMAKAISEVTGLGLSLYETGDLQFEEDGSEAAKKGLAAGGVKEANKGISPTTAGAPVPAATPEAPKPAAPIADDQVKALEKLQQDPVLCQRIDKALSNYKIGSIKQLNANQAANIIKVLTPKPVETKEKKE